MMPTKCYIFAFLFSIVVSYNAVFVHGIRCYECSSYLDDKCGTTWGFSEAAGDKYLTECDETASGCKKLQYEELHAGVTIVTRSCFNGTTNGTSYMPLGCQTFRESESCYCIPENDQEACNGQEHTLVSISLQFFSLLMILCLASYL